MFKALFLALLALPMTLFAGGSDGGGGNGVVCFNPENAKEILSVELLDFYEGRVLEGHEYSERSGEYLSIFNQVAKEKAASKLVSIILEYGNTLNKGFKFLPKGVKLRPIDDSNEIFIPENCRIEQIANFQGPSRIFIVSDYWNYLSETNKAGLLMHEQLWWMERQRGYESSARARRTVARFFADNYKFEKINHEVKVGDLYCVSGNLDMTYYKTSFFVIRQSDDKCLFSFENLNGAPAYSKTEFINHYCNQFMYSANGNGFSTVHEVEVYPERSISHYIRLDVRSFPDGDRAVARKIHIQNLEFPGFDDKMDNLQCSPIREENLEFPWW